MAKEEATVESLKAKTEALTEKAMKLGEAVYKAAQEAQKQESEKTAESGENKDAKDADFSEK